jgi:hypothetical protein
MNRLYRAIEAVERLRDTNHMDGKTSLIAAAVPALAIALTAGMIAIHNPAKHADRTAHAAPAAIERLDLAKRVHAGIDAMTEFMTRLAPAAGADLHLADEAGPAPAGPRFR